MAKRNDPEKYGKVDWKSIVMLDEASPTGITWLVSKPRQHIVAGTPAGYFRKSAREGRQTKYQASLYYSDNKVKSYYSVANIIRILKGEPLSPTKEEFKFREDTSAWIQANSNNVWWAIHTQCNTPAILSRLRRARLIGSVGYRFDPDFLQDVFTEACTSFNKHYDKTKGAETTYMHQCVWSAIDKLVSKEITARKHFPIVGQFGEADRKHDCADNMTSFVYHPDPTDHVAEIDQADAMAVAKAKLDATAARIFQRDKHNQEPSRKKIFDLLMQGYTQLEIAKKLKISRQRVHQLRDSMMKLLKHSVPSTSSIP